MVTPKQSRPLLLEVEAEEVAAPEGVAAQVAMSLMPPVQGEEAAAAQVDAVAQAAPVALLCEPRRRP